MRRITGTIMAATVLVGTAVSSGLAQQAPAPRDRDRRGPEQREAWRNTQGAVEASRVVGTRVRSADGRDLGEIDQLMIDPRSGRITHAVIGLGGFAGIGEQKVVVPWSEVKLRSEEAAGRTQPGAPEAPGQPGPSREQAGAGRLVAIVDQSAIDRAPRYEASAAREQERPPAASPETERERPRPPAPGGGPSR